MTVWLVGAGPGDPGLVTVRGLELIRGCDVLVYDVLVAPELVDEAFVAGYSNDYLGYFLTRQDYGRPSYVACGSLYGETGGEIVRDAAVDLLDRLAAQRSGR